MTMFRNVSMTSVGVIVVTITSLFKWLGIDGVENADIAVFVNQSIQVIGFVWMVYGQWRRRDLIAGVVKK